MNRFYTYAYFSKRGKLYYIGKGKGRRAWDKNNRTVRIPPDKNNITILKNNLTEEEAYKHEIYMISIIGRRDLGTGPLMNKTDGGEGLSGSIRTEEYKKEKSFSMKKFYNNPDNYAKLCAHNKKVGANTAQKNRARQRTHWRKEVWDMIEESWIASGGSFQWGRAEVMRKTGAKPQEIRAILRLVKGGLTWENAINGHHVR
jgi:hypothetical protein